jgi:membrane-associated phospholipid phosphatase
MLSLVTRNVRRAGGVVVLAAFLAGPVAAAEGKREEPVVLAQSPEPPPSPAPGATGADPQAKPPAPSRWAPDDKRRTLKGYKRNLLYNLLGVVTPGNRSTLLVTGALTAPALAWDDEVVSYFGKHPHDNFGKIGANLGGGIAVVGLTLGGFSAGRLSHRDRFRAMTYDVSQAVIVNQAWTYAFKLSVRRERPDHSDRASFFSGHASNAFAVAASVTRHYPALAVPAYAVATYIAASRMAANKHHFSDVVAGAGFGFGVGRLVVRRNGRPPDQGKVDTDPKTSRLFRIVPDGGPRGDGRGLALSVSF